MDRSLDLTLFAMVQNLLARYWGLLTLMDWQMVHYAHRAFISLLNEGEGQTLKVNKYQGF